MITWTYEPDFAAEFTPIRRITFELEDETTWRDLVEPFNNFLAAISYVPIEDNYKFVKAVDEG